jgi:hypothetical protein
MFKITALLSTKGEQTRPKNPRAGLNSASVSTCHRWAPLDKDQQYNWPSTP